ncbi:MAG TPA: hypothetical protein PLI45_00180 [Candidatus Woesebacteria bacterium]|nr:hypothetical protein [Candidatus Woesebacteria bacterium]
MHNCRTELRGSMHYLPPWTVILAPVFLVAVIAIFISSPPKRSK